MVHSTAEEAALSPRLSGGLGGHRFFSAANREFIASSATWPGEAYLEFSFQCSGVLGVTRRDRDSVTSGKEMSTGTPHRHVDVSQMLLGNNADADLWDNMVRVQYQGI